MCRHKNIDPALPGDNIDQLVRLSERRTTTSVTPNGYKTRAIVPHDNQKDVVVRKVCQTGKNVALEKNGKNSVSKQTPPPPPQE
jgi:hypothetical protein